MFELRYFYKFPLILVHADKDSNVKHIEPTTGAERRESG